MTTTFAVQTKVISGAGSTSRLAEEVRGLATRRLLVVVDQGLVESGLTEPLVAQLPTDTIAAQLVVPADPDVEAVEKLIQTAINAACDAVVVIGGGSAMAVGKAASIRLTNDMGLVEFEGLAQAPNPPAPTIAVPTTAGSGSEVSRVLIVHQEGRHTDLALRVEGSQPRVAILDGTLMRGLPRAPMLYAGLDALSHCLESLWAKRAGSYTRSLALSAADEVLNLLPLALDGSVNGANSSGENDAVLQRLIEASCAANMACGNSGMGLVHGFSSAPAIKLPHGLRNGIVLPFVAEFNAPLLHQESIALIERIEPFYRRIEFTPSFAPYSIGPDGIDAMVAATVGHPFRANNIRSATDAELRELLVAAGATTEGRN